MRRQIRESSIPCFGNDTQPLLTLSTTPTTNHLPPPNRCTMPPKPLHQHSQVYMNYWFSQSSFMSLRSNFLHKLISLFPYEYFYQVFWHCSTDDAPNDGNLWFWQNSSLKYLHDNHTVLCTFITKWYKLKRQKTSHFLCKSFIVWECCIPYEIAILMTVW